MRRATTLALAAVGIGVAIWLSMGGEARLRPKFERKSFPDMAPRSAPAAVSSDPSARSEISRAAPLVAIAPPKREATLAEVSQDPHSPPPSLVAFAANLGERMSAALESEAQAAGLMTELESCARTAPEQTLPAAIAICATDAERLGQTYGALTARADALKSDLPTEVLDLVHLALLGEDGQPKSN